MTFTMRPMPRKPRFLTFSAFLEGAAGSDASRSSTDANEEGRSRGKAPYNLSFRPRKRGWSLVDEMDDGNLSVPGRVTASFSDESSVSSFFSDSKLHTAGGSQRPAKSPRGLQDHPALHESLHGRILSFSSDLDTERDDRPSLPLLDEDLCDHGERIHEEGSTECNCNILHMTCLYFPHDLPAIETALQGSPIQSAQVPFKLPQTAYSFPLHIVLSQLGASAPWNSSLPSSRPPPSKKETAQQLAVVQLLVKEAPSVLRETDGPTGEEVTPLALALRLGIDAEVCRFLLQSDLTTATLHNGTKHNELPLHLACQRMVQKEAWNAAHDDHHQLDDGVLLEVILTLLQAYPAAVLLPNHQGETPLAILQWSGKSSPPRSPQCASALEFLQRTARSFDL